MGALHFPETVLVESVKPGSHSLYLRPWAGAPLARFYESSRPQKIEFSRKECVKLDESTLEFVVWHELGHWFRINHVELKEISGREEGTKFLILGAPNSEEGFADAFASYFFIGDLPEHPAQKEELTKLLRKFDEAEIRSFVALVTSKLSAQLKAP